MTTIEWINHASFSLRHGSVHLITDPWIEGSVFNDAWSLIAPTVFDYERFQEATHIWFSHEHPDHFSPVTLKRMPEDVRRAITVLYQRTHDKRVLEFCGRLGFSCAELPPGRPFQLTPGVELINGSVDSDSWLCVRAAGLTLLNLNDCAFSNARALRKIRERCGAVDVLLTQFSYATWAGNSSNVAMRARAAQAKIDSLLQQIEALEPKCVVPCASFVRFSHEENVFMNDSVNDIGAVHDIIAKTGAKPVVLYPGDLWAVGSPHDSARAISRYRQDWEASRTVPLARSKRVTTDELLAAGRECVDRLRSRNAMWMLKPLMWLGVLRPVRIFVRDLKKVVSFDMYKGLREASDRDVHIAMSADALAFCLRFDFGFDTTMIGGRFEEVSPGGRFVASRQFALARRNNDGLYFPSLLWRGTYALRKLKQFTLGR